MLCIMRTTISLDENLGNELKERVQAEGVSLSALIAELLRKATRPERPEDDEPPLELVTVGGAPAAGVNLDRTSELLMADDDRYGPR